MDNKTILAVDDAKDTLLLLEFDLTAEGYSVIFAESGEQALEVLSLQNVSLILLDMYMPGLSGLDTLKRIKSSNNHANTPVIMLSSSHDGNEIVAALELGADDYVTKPYLAKVLLARIRTSLRLIQKTKALEALAKIDFLTDINNRASFEELSGKAISQANRCNQSLSFAMMDIDFFKKVNDTYGHEAGDKVLKAFGQNLKNQVRDYDIIGRVGGEEFAVCMPNTIDEHAIFACDRIRQHTEKLEIDVGNNHGNISITVSIGVVSVQGGTTSLENLMRIADKALYEAKSKGRNRVIMLPYVEEPLAQSTHASAQGSNISDEDIYPGIDYQLGVNNVLGDDGLFKEILLMFYQDHGQDKEKINKALSQNDIFAAKNLVHTLKGVACSIGAMQLFESTKKLDLAINEQRADEYSSLYNAMAEDLDTIVNGLRELQAEFESNKTEMS
ncbi:diguanylate cyclase [Thalassotalea fusca]